MGVPVRREGLTYGGERSSHYKASGGSETSKYPEEKKSKGDSPSSGERKGKSQNSVGVRLQLLPARGFRII